MLWLVMASCSPSDARAGSGPKSRPTNLVVTNTSLVGVFASGYTPEELDAIHSELSNLVSSGQLQNAVTIRVSFADLPSALQRLADRSDIGTLVKVP
jgi:NADPH2:quinone reductase